MTPRGTPSPTDPLRIAGILIAASTPVSAFLCFAAAAILFGEQHFEGPGGVTMLGALVMALPLLVGLALVALSFTGAPTHRFVGLAAAGAAIASFGLGLWSTTTSAETSDASIGGGLLVVFSVLLAVAAAISLRPRRDPNR